MALYAYTGTLTDLGGAPFPGAIPNLYVKADRDTFGPDGPIAAGKRVQITVAPNGTFRVLLTASGDVSPAVKYTLYCEWLDSDTPLGWASWEFTAYVGGGPIKDGVGAPVAGTWWVGPPWPPAGTQGMYVHKRTNDVWKVGA